MNKLFQPWQLGPLNIPNRLVRSATVEGLSDENGAPTPRLTDILVALAEGETGLIIAGTAYISREGRGDRYTTGMHNDELIPALSQMCKTVADKGGILVAQLLHCGSTLNPDILEEKQALYGPSPMKSPVCDYPVTELTKPQILSIVDEYAKAAVRAKKSGFAAVQIHGGHGYLINQFLSPSRNVRQDEYGGSIENRSRLVTQVYQAIRGAVGQEFPILIKMSAHDGFSGGVLPHEAARTAAILDEMGIDAIEVSAGTPEGARNGGWDHILPAPFEEGSLLKYALEIKANVSCPVISVEGWRDPQKIETALEKVDAISMSRPFIREPDLARRWASGDRSRALCISCNKCLDLIADSGLDCIFNIKKRQGQNA